MPEAYHPAFMQRAIALSETAYKSGKGLPIGCVIVKDGAIVGEGHNEIFLRNNPTAHAEMVAIENACKNSGNLQLTGCELYTSLEPCPMCFGAIYWAGIQAVYFAATGADAITAGFADLHIAGEFHKPRAEQRIPMHHAPDPLALNVLQDWKRINPDLNQIP
jgi:guanine deaminase